MTVTSLVAVGGNMLLWIASETHWRYHLFMILLYTGMTTVMCSGFILFTMFAYTRIGIEVIASERKRQNLKLCFLLHRYMRK